MEVSVNHLGAAQFEIKARGHTVYADQPLENGGFDEAMTPPELLLASLGACAGYYAVEYCTKNHLDPGNVQVRVNAEKAKAPARLGSFRIQVLTSGVLTEVHRQGVLNTVKKCLIHNTLIHPPHIHIEVTAQGISLAA